jgi:hypothetical protein
MSPFSGISLRLALATPLFLVLPAIAAFGLEPAPESGPCSLEDAAPATLIAVEADFSVVLDDGRRITLAGLELPPPGSDAATPLRLRDRLVDWLVGKPVFVGAFAAQPDRWGHLPARLFAAASVEKESPLVLVGVALLEAGAVRYRPDRRAASCARAYLAAEAAALAGGLGLWADLDLRPVAVPSAAMAGLSRRTGMTIVEGVVRSTGNTSGAFYLNLGGGGEFSVVISRRISYKNFPSGFDPAHFVGRRVRVRGLIETGFGPRLEIAYPEEIEFVDPP